jgi:hypothetical protein
MKAIIFLLTLISFAPCEETFMQEIIGLVQPLAILGIFWVPPILIVAILMVASAAGKKGAELTTDLFKNDEEEEE